MNKKLIIALVILLVVAAGIFYFLTMGNIGTKYNTAEVEKGQVEKFVDEVGTISSKNIRNYYGNSLSRVEEMDLELGDYVKKGQLLIKFEDNIDLEIQKVEKQIEALKATYNEAQSGSDFGSINSAKIKIAGIKSSIDLANENKSIIEELYKNGAAAESELKQAVYNLEQLQNDLLVAQNSYNQLGKGLSANMKAKYEAEIDVLILSLETLEKSKNNSLIYADFDGVITELNTFEGDTPSAGLMILEIMDPLEKIIVVDFMVKDALLIETGMKAEVNDLDLGIRIDNIEVQKIHPKSFTVYSELGVEENRQRVEINLPQSNQELSFGLKVDTRVMVEEPREAIFIPEDAIYEKNLKKYVEVLEEKKPVEREVVTGIENNNNIEIKEGLEEGEQVILIYEKK
ncbi:MAG: HlyD family efflux transporter periplasmic adaptor subunit [Gudongella sp.]|nr:HlyD family efflux transporter periplasmic adaptor subunit [Gudongella sp.]